MFDHITLISDRGVSIKLTPEAKASGVNLMNMHVVFVNGNQRILGEVKDITETTVDIKFLGEFTDRGFVTGILRKPSLDSTLRMINEQELQDLIGTNFIIYFL